MESTSDLRILSVRPLLPPGVLAEEIPVTEEAASLIARSRREITACLRGEDPRLVVVVGPCSVHDPAAVLDYAAKLKEGTKSFAGELLIVMRAYFEKPRTTVGWKGFVNDPEIDGSFQINKGLRRARLMLSELAELGLPAATEFLDMTTPQHIADYISWGAIGARTCESQTHRELASGLSMPVGFKNATDGDVKAAINGIQTAKQGHWFMGASREGVTAILQTTGNDACHLILRGGTRTGPNYSSDHVARASKQLLADGLPSRVMIDFSHGNSGKDHHRQIDVAKDVAGQLEEGAPIFGVMIESFLAEGRQDWAGSASVYGQSITDACIGFSQTIDVLGLLAEAAK
ncbi:MAG: 3-deoxy-7-phosphoheptulonate synthase [Fimbriimonas sp.]